MKPFLLNRDRDFDPLGALPWNEEALTQDLELATLFGSMALGDEFLHDIARRAVLTPLSDPAAILYRQDILEDCLTNPVTVREIYDLAVETIESEKKNYWGLFMGYPDSILRRSVDVLNMFVASLRELRAIAEKKAASFASDGFRTFFAMLRDDLSGDYFSEVQDRLKELKFRDGVLIRTLPA